MKIKLLSLIISCFLFQSTACAQTSLLWDKYFSLSQAAQEVDYTSYPGKIFLFEYVNLYTSAWKFRSNTYEVFFDDKQKLGRTVYDLAIFTGDIPENTSLERVEKGVEGFHYNIDQICAWLNNVFYAKQKTPSQDTFTFITYLLQDNVVKLVNGVFVPGKFKHVLAVAEGRKRSLEQNLRHERLHVYWDEEPAFKKIAQEKWNALSQKEKDKFNKELKNYAKNEELRLEEWAVREAEQERIKLSGL